MYQKIYTRGNLNTGVSRLEAIEKKMNMLLQVLVLNSDLRRNAGRFVCDLGRIANET